ncbi:hypothetical protein [Hymenobacter jeollabukensis]|uniref:Uncharacterized protein n=1 Tax=Hymenobacter jeollabukensis TaxID=2025313 RepID=A0A5R8WTF1_9BACT|nr:hypothetical protein [Hymenobacter jeollabukensis]TLM95050.1 hypothetical protein FDY95_04415 [Hymenobacter jeollabukensis]
MTNYLLLAAGLLLTWPAAAQTPAKAAKPAQMAAATPTRALLKGTWQSADDNDFLLVITDKQYIERYAGQPDEARSLRVLDRACDAAPGTKSNGSLYLQTTAADNMCYYLVGVTATRLQLSPVGGRGNTLTFKRVTQSASKRLGMP